MVSSCNLIRRKVADEQFVTMLTRLLKAGVMSRRGLREDEQGLSTRLTTLPDAFQYRLE